MGFMILDAFREPEFSFGVTYDALKPFKGSVLLAMGKVLHRSAQNRDQGSPCVMHILPAGEAAFYPGAERICYFQP